MRGSRSGWAKTWQHVYDWSYTIKGAVARYCACTAMIDSGSWLTNKNWQKQRPVTMQILWDFVVFAGTSRMFFSSPTTSSLILKSIRERLIEDTVNTVSRNLCNYTRNHPNTFTAWLEICDRFNGLCWYRSDCNEHHFYACNQTNIIQTQWFFKLGEEIVWPVTFLLKE